MATEFASNVLIVVVRPPLLSNLVPIEEQLRQALTGPVCVIGVGNRMRGDDGAGPRLIEQLQSRSCLNCLDAGTTPENYLETVVKIRPTVILLIDACDFGDPPGAARLFRDDELSSDLRISTHALSLGMTRDYLKERLGCSVFLLGIQAQRLAWGEEPGQAVLETIKALAGILDALLPHRA